jgi:hypothetical protein
MHSSETIFSGRRVLRWNSQNVCTIYYMFTTDGAPILQGGQVGSNLMLSSGYRSSTQTNPSTVGTFRSQNN